MLDDVQRAAIELALDTLDAQPDYRHSSALIIRIAGNEVAAQVAGLATEYREANKAAKEQSGALLSAEAADYWQEAQGVLRYAKVVQAGNDRDFKKEKTLSRKCERLEESFAARVPDFDKPKFVQFDPQSLDAQDERWNWCVDGNFPLLHEQFRETMPFRNPVGEAQRTVLNGLLDEREPAVQTANVSRLRLMLSGFIDERQERNRKENVALTRRVEATKKRREAAAKRAARKAKKAEKDRKKAEKEDAKLPAKS